MGHYNAFFRVTLDYNQSKLIKKQQEKDILREAIDFIFQRVFYPHNLYDKKVKEFSIIHASRKKGFDILVEVENLVFGNLESITKQIRDFNIHPDFLKNIKLVKAEEKENNNYISLK